MSSPKVHKQATFRAFMAGIIAMLIAAFGGLSSASATNTLPDPAGAVVFTQPSCTVDHVVANITDATPLGEDGDPFAITYRLFSERGQESETPTSVPRFSSFTLESLPLAFGETLELTVMAELDTSIGEPQLVVIDSFTATRPQAQDCTADQTHKVFVCKVVGGPGHYSLKEGKQPIEVDASALEADVQPVVGAPFSDAQPSFVVASDDRALCEAGLPPTDDGTTVTPTAPTSVDTCGVTNDAYTVPSKDGVVYKVDGVIKAAGTYQATGAVTVTAHPANETVVLEGKTSWTFKFTNVPCQPDPVIAPRASLSSECEILDGEKSGLTVVNAVLGSASSDGDSFEVAETIDGVTVFYYIPVAAGEEITPQVFYSAEDGKTVSLVINARDVALASLSFNTAGCAATVTPPPLPLMKVCPQGTKWVDVNHNNTVDKGECKTPVTHKPAVANSPVKSVTSPNNSVPSADTGWETHQNQDGSMLPWLLGLGLLTGAALVTATIMSRRRGAYRD